MEIVLEIYKDSIGDPCFFCSPHFVGYRRNMDLQYTTLLITCQDIALYIAVGISLLLLVLMYKFWWYNLTYNLRSVLNSSLFGVFVTMLLVTLLGNQDVLALIQTHNKVQRSRLYRKFSNF
jgi:hypothetical protein